TNETRNLLSLDSDGDVILECQDQDSPTTTAFRVSRKVLQLASPVFLRMFGPHFKEGNQLPQEESPVVELKEDDASLMNIILNILHFRSSDDNYGMDAERLARLAIHCDKYDLPKALGPWISFWFDKVETASASSEELGFMLLAAYLFNDIKKFREISEMALIKTSPGFEDNWEEQDLLALLPISIPDAMSLRVKQTLDNIETEIQDVESSLRLSLRSYETSQRLCTLCGRALPEQAKKCHPCYNTDLPPKYCTTETRIAEYFAVLRKVELWPTLQPFGACSVSDIISRITR
ncbi:hypothetical protein DM02DRAFT_508345, partial [Periconia macrospinosa]